MRAVSHCKIYKRRRVDEEDTKCFKDGLNIGVIFRVWNQPNGSLLDVGQKMSTTASDENAICEMALDQWVVNST